MSIIIGIDHGYYAIKTAHSSFPAGLISYGEHEPYTRQGLLEFGGCFFVCGTGRQPIQRDKTINDNYYLLTLVAIAKEIRQRNLPPECSVRIAAGLPLTSFGRDKPKFREYLLRSNQPVNYKFEGVEYSITIEEVAVFPQGYAALMTEVGLLQDEPSMLLMDLGGWTVDLMRIDNAIPAADTAHSLELGMIRCVDDIREQVRRETGLSLTDLVHPRGASGGGLQIQSAQASQHPLHRGRRRSPLRLHRRRQRAGRSALRTRKLRTAGYGRFSARRGGRNEANHTKNSEVYMKLNHNKKSVKISLNLFALYAVMVCGIVFAPPAFAASDPLVVVENLSTFIFSLIRAVGLILLGWGIVQVGLSLQSHDPSQRSQGFLTLAGGLVITFAKEILDLITA